MSDTKNSACLISFLNFSELIPAFSCAKVIGNLLSIWYEVNIFSPWFSWFSASDFFCLLNFVFSGTFFTNSGSGSNSDSDSNPGPGSGFWYVENH